jgi:hypothetical protein
VVAQQAVDDDRHGGAHQVLENGDQQQAAERFDRE